MSFKDKYKTKSETVARDGSNAMLVNASSGHGGSNARRTSVGNTDGSRSSVATGAVQQPVAAAPQPVAQQYAPQPQLQQPMYSAPPPIAFNMFQAPPPLPGNGFYAAAPVGSSPYGYPQQMHAGAAMARPTQLGAQPTYVARQPHDAAAAYGGGNHGGGGGGGGGGALAASIQPQAAVAREDPRKRRPGKGEAAPSPTVHPQQQQQQQQQVYQNQFSAGHVPVHNLSNGGAGGGGGAYMRTVSPGRGGTLNTSGTTPGVQALSPLLQQQHGYGSEHRERERRKDPLPDFSYAPVIQHGRRAGKPQEPPPIIGNYKPHTLREYKQLKDEIAHQRWGGLGADDNEEKQAAREKRQRIFQYGRSVNSVNFAMMELLEEKAGAPDGPGLSEEGRIAKMKRERALRYGQEHGYSPGRVKKSMTPDPTPTAQLGSSTLDEQLTALEEKQRRDQDRILQIKHQLGLICSDELYGTGGGSPSGR